jgi:hypothetical protein
LIFTKLALALAVGFLGASPFARASGLMTGSGIERGPDGPITLVCGMILFCLTLGLIGPTLRLIQRILAILARIEDRPAPMVALGFVIAGTVCVIAALTVQYSASREIGEGLTMHMGGQAGNARIGLQASGSGLGLGILTFGTFLLGASLISLGIWTSFKPSRSVMKPEPEPMAA